MCCYNAYSFQCFQKSPSKCWPCMKLLPSWCIHYYFSFPISPEPLPAWLSPSSHSHSSFSLGTKIGVGKLGGRIDNEEGQGLIRRNEYRFWSQTWFEFLSLPVANCATLKKSLRLKSLSFVACKMGLVTALSQGYSKKMEVKKCTYSTMLGAVDNGIYSWQTDLSPPPPGSFHIPAQQFLILDTH